MLRKLVPIYGSCTFCAHYACLPFCPVTRLAGFGRLMYSRCMSHYACCTSCMLHKLHVAQVACCTSCMLHYAKVHLRVFHFIHICASIHFRLHFAHFVHRKLCTRVLPYLLGVMSNINMFAKVCCGTIPTWHKMHVQMCTFRCCTFAHIALYVLSDVTHISDCTLRTLYTESYVHVFCHTYSV